MLHLQKQRDRGGGVTIWGWQQGQPQSIDAASVHSARVDLKSVWKHANTDTTPTSRLIRDKDQLSGEKPVAWEHLCVRLQCSAESGLRECVAAVLQMRRRRLTGFCRVFSSAGLRSPWLRSCSTALRFGSRVLTPPRTNKEEKMISSASQWLCLHALFGKRQYSD